METMQLQPIPQEPTGNNQLTMSSREIAELTGKQHKHVMADIRKMLDELNRPNFRPVEYLDAKGERRPEYQLPKRETLILVSGYNIEFRARIIDRWQELENQITTSPAIDFSDPKILLGVVQHLQVEVDKKDEIIAEQVTRLKKLDRLENAAGSMCISDAAKTLKVQNKWLFNFMHSRRFIFKRVGNKNWLAYDDKRKSGYLEHDDHIYIDKQGNERVSTRVLVTAKGLVKLAELIEQPLH